MEVGLRASNVVDGCMPSDLGAGTTAELEEERRLLYVAMTRAKDDLHLIVPQRFFMHGQQRAWRPPCLCVPDALHTGPFGETVRSADMAVNCPGGTRGTRSKRADGYSRTHARHVALAFPGIKPALALFSIQLHFVRKEQIGIA